MKLSFSVIVQQTIGSPLADAKVLSVDIPSLQFHKKLGDIDRNFLKLLGMSNYLKGCITDILEEKEEYGDNIEPSRSLNTVVKLLTDTDTAHSTETDDAIENLFITVPVDFNPKKKQCHCCEKSIPWFVGTTIILEAMLGTLLGLFQMEYLQGDSGLIKMDAKTNLATSVLLSSMSLFYGLWQIFTSGEILFLKDTGAMIDKKFSALWDWIRGNKPNKQKPKKQNERGYTKSGVAFAASKTAFILGFLSAQYNLFVTGYNALTSVGNMIGKNLWIPPEDFVILQWTMFGLTHVDDPLVFTSILYLGFATIDGILNNRYFKKPPEKMDATMEHDINQRYKNRFDSRNRNNTVSITSNSRESSVSDTTSLLTNNSVTFFNNSKRVAAAIELDTHQQEDNTTPSRSGSPTYERLFTN